MSKKVFERFDGPQVTDIMIQEASQLFSENYGIWGEQAAEKMGKFAKFGKSIRSVRSLRIKTTIRQPCSTQQRKTAK